jgi:hypothetical protein
MEQLDEELVFSLRKEEEGLMLHSGGSVLILFLGELLLLL